VLKLLLEDLGSSFVLGLLTPLTALCTLPLFPGFLAYLTEQLSSRNIRISPFGLSLIVSLGTISFMVLFGLVFSTILQVSLTNVIGIISPIAFFFLGAVSIAMILDYDLSSLFPQFQAPISKNPIISAYSFGFFFGAIVIPCNPLFIAAIFAKNLLSNDALLGVFNFLFFGFGISFPLVLFSLLSGSQSSSIIKFLIKHKRNINLFSGIIMLLVSIYYIVFVFKIFGAL